MTFGVGAADADAYNTAQNRGALRSYRSRTIFGAVWDRDMVSALEHAGAVELDAILAIYQRSKTVAVDRLEGPRSRRHEVVCPPALARPSAL